MRFERLVELSCTGGEDVFADRLDGVVVRRVWIVGNPEQQLVVDPSGCIFQTDGESNDPAIGDKLERFF